MALMLVVSNVAPATAQSTVMASNLGEAEAERSQRNQFHVVMGQAYAQSFSTGGAAVTLEKVRLHMRGRDSAAPAVTIRADSSGQPGRSLHALTSPSVDQSIATFEDFTTDGYVLAANTTYWVVVSTPWRSDGFNFSVTLSDNVPTERLSDEEWAEENQCAGSGCATIRVLEDPCSLLGPPEDAFAGQDGWSLGDNLFFGPGSKWDGVGCWSMRVGIYASATVTPRQIILPPIGVGGGGGGRTGPTPSEVDFEWNVKRDIEELDGGNDRATGVWSDGTTLWVADNADGAGDTVYAYDLASGERVEEREFELDERNRAPRGVWSDRTTIWVSDSGQEKLFAHNLESGERLPERDIALAERNRDARGIWSDGETMWVLDGVKDSLFAYDIASGDLLAEYELSSANDDPRGIWSDGVTVWVSNHDPKRLFAYRLPVLPDAETDSGEEDAGDDRELERVRDEEFDKLSRAGNNSPRGIWSDGDVMYVADESDDRVYTYNMPDAIDARLASLTLSGVDIGEFDPGRPDYEAVVADGVTETTVEAEAMQPRTTIVTDPEDADTEVDGHQVALQDLGEVTVTVTSADGSRTRVYRVQFPDTGWDPARDPWPHCLRGAVSEGFSLVVYEGGSVEELMTCAESRDIVALYALHEGVYVSHILGAPDFVNAGFLELFPDGLPSITPLVAASNGPPSADPFGDLEDGAQQPWPQCLRGAVSEGFSLVVYEGGSGDELEACARSMDVTALYTLSEGEFVSYILGAPDFVTQPFRDLFADGLPPMTPLVAKSEGQPDGR